MIYIIFYSTKMYYHTIISQHNTQHHNFNMPYNVISCHVIPNPVLIVILFGHLEHTESSP